MRHAGRPRSPKSPTSRPSTSRWHLSKQGHVVIDCPKMAEALWPAAFQPPRALAAAPEPSPVEQTGGVGGAVVAAEVEVAAREPAAAAAEASALDAAGAAEVARSAPARLVQGMGQHPASLALQLRGAKALASALEAVPRDAEPRLALAVVNARGVAVLLAALRRHGQHAELQREAWRTLHALFRVQGCAESLPTLRAPRPLAHPRPPTPTLALPPPPMPLPSSGM